VLEQDGAEAAALLGVLDDERDLGGGVAGAALVAPDRDQPLA